MKRVLLIDDDAADRLAVRRALRSLSDDNYELVEAADGASGLALARQSDFDCVLLDFHLPDAEAFDLLGELISPEGRRQAVVMLTGEVNQELAERLMRAGALDYLTKGETSPANLARAIRYAQARRAFVAELQEAREIAEAQTRMLDGLNRQKTLLLSIIAHDLRNPFQALLGLSQMLSSDVEKKTPLAVERQAQGLFDAANRAHVLIEGLFSWASLQMESSTIELSRVELDVLANDCADALAMRAKQKSIDIDVDCGGLEVLGQRDMLLAVLRNLGLNGIKFTPQGGRVRIWAREAGENVEVGVSDNGVGLSQEQIERLFKIERRVSMAGTDGETGAGLGLLLCQELMELQGSALKAQSGPGGGATFFFRLPKPPVERNGS